MEQILNIALPYVITFIGAYIGNHLVKIVPFVIEYIVSKIGAVNYEKMKTTAIDIWHAIEEDARLGDLAGNKINAFESMLIARYPNISSADIRLLNKSIAGVVNSDKKTVVDTIAETESKVITVQPIIKYVNENGVELQPVQTQNTTAN